MFSAIAHSYDINNRVHSLGLDQWWRGRVVVRAGPAAGADVLDVACGTGDLSAHFARAQARSVVGLDYTAAMLEIARTKALREGGAVGAIRFVEGDAQALPYADATFDIVTIAFGIRNVLDPLRAIAEFRRVLRPGGRLAILEFAEPTSRVVRALHGLYTQRIMPWTATLLARDRSGAYRYLPRSVATFMSPEELAARVRERGFAKVETIRMTLGTCAITLGTVASS
jgi:demethylmenaquinone methyltransferase/2-methoxy-6-polyprenyl-1,4-benzoquinol methylase